MKRATLLAAAASVYLLAAWAVAPGFYDGFTPPKYSWVSPPPIDAQGNSQPQSGHLDINLVNGSTDASSVFTTDTYPQAVIGFLPGAFDPTGKTRISVDVKPVATFPTPTGLQFATNVYLITADAPLVKDANLDLLYSGNVPAPSFIYLAIDANSPWKSIGGSEGAPYEIQAATRQLGYFAAGYPANTTRAGAASQLLPIAVAILIVGVLIAGIPLAVVRRRREAAGVGESDETDDR